MATGAPSACGRSSQAAYPTLTFEKQKLFGRGVEPPFVFQQQKQKVAPEASVTPYGMPKVAGASPRTGVAYAASGVATAPEAAAAAAPAGAAAEPPTVRRRPPPTPARTTTPPALTSPTW